MKIKTLLIFIIITVFLVSCSKSEDILDLSDDNGEIILNKESIIENDINTAIDISTESEKEVDYKSFFNGINGVAVFYHPTTNIYDLYNQSLCKERISPYSTFKIISTLMGLSQGIVTSLDTKLGYDGTKYSREELNKDLTLKEAFQISAVWYYKKLVNLLDKYYVQNTLINLKYGNADVSAWDESGHNDFWLDSSLKISPIEQVKVLYKIFNDESLFSKNDINLLKKVMLFESNDKYSVYGKTGTGQYENAWYVGFLEKQSETIYFAVCLEEKNVSGAIAREILMDIIKSKYV